MAIGLGVVLVGVRVEVRDLLKLPIRTEPSDNKPIFGFSTTSAIYASEIGVRGCGFGDFFARGYGDRGGGGGRC